MSTFPLDEPHLAALRSACALTIAAGNPPGFLEGLADRADEPARSASRALSSPASAASLVRDLLARAGVDVGGYRDDDKSVKVYSVDVDSIDCVTVWIGKEVYTWPMSDVPRLALALLDLAPGDAEGAMRALREVGR